MATKIDRDNLGYLGNDYQFRLMAQILTDSRFAHSIIDIVNPNYFEDQYLRIIAAVIKDAKAKDDIIPDMGSIEFRLLEDVKDDMQRKYTISQLRKVQSSSLHDTMKVQDIAMKFCKQQELKKSIKEIQKIIDKGDIENYEECETILRKALEHGDNKDDGMDVFDNIDNVLVDDFRKPIRTGISGLDEVMDGGLSKTELAVILAPFGVGKTTMMTKIANTAMNDGYKVLQIFFEDSKKDIQRKHFTCWSGIGLGELSKAKEYVKQKAIDHKKNGGKLILKKCPSDATTVGHIKQYLRYLRNKGIVIDMLVLDYLDCVSATRTSEDQNTNEGTVIRQLEGLIAEFNMAGWVAAQSNRSGITADIVGIESIQGSIKRAQVGHLVISAGKTLPQKEMGLATMAILKSRFGGDGIVFKDMTFKNDTMEFNTEENSIVSQFGFENDREKKQEEQKKQRTIEALENFRKEKNKIITPTI